MSENKTQPTDAGVENYLSTISDPSRRADCESLIELLGRVTGQPPVMWGATIVGFGRYHYTYESGRSGEWFVVGFSSRKNDIALYTEPVFPERETLLAQLGKLKQGKGCVYLRSLANVDRAALEQFVRAASAARQQ